MDKQASNRKKWRYLALGALLGVPVTVLAISGTDLSISTYGWFGAYSGSSSSSGPALAIGTAAYWDYSKVGLAAVGSNVTAYDSNSMAVGYWNKQTAGSGDAFVVGYGTSLVQKNALEVHSDGTVRIGEAQHEAEAPMGVYQDPAN